MGKHSIACVVAMLRIDVVRIRVTADVKCLLLRSGIIIIYGLNPESRVMRKVIDL